MSSRSPERPAIRIAVVTIFPGMFPGPLAYGVVGRAIESGLVRLDVVDLRDHADLPHRQVDDQPFGGGAGMVLKPEPLFRAVRALRDRFGEPRPRVVLLDPGGRPLTQGATRGMARESGLVLICGRYEGVDHRVRTELVDDEVSIGDYVLSGGELPAMVVVDAVARLVPGVVGEPASVARESFEGRALDCPAYTRPAEFEGLVVPEVLRSGDHARIEAWRRDAAVKRTRLRRPELLDETEPLAPSRGRDETRKGR